MVDGGGGHDGLLHTQSVTKLVLNVVLARAAALGHIGSVDDPVHRWLPDWATRRRKRVLLRHLMGHTSGLSCDWQELRTADPDDWVSYCRALPVSAEPGEVAAYNIGAVMLLPAIVAAAVGRPFLDFVAEEIFGPLGIPDFTWGTDRAGNPFGMSTSSCAARTWHAWVSFSCSVVGGRAASCSTRPGWTPAWRRRTRRHRGSACSCSAIRTCAVSAASATTATAVSTCGSIPDPSSSSRGCAGWTHRSTDLTAVSSICRTLPSDSRLSATWRDSELSGERAAVLQVCDTACRTGGRTCRHPAGK